MQYTGITRRIDELGRVVIPKEIRRTMRLREGEEMEIFVDENSLILKKYSCVKGIQKFSEEIVESLFSSTGDTSLVTDLDKIVAAAGFDKTFYSDKLLLQKVAEIFQKRTARTVFLPDGYAITGDDTNEYKMQIFAPVIVAGDVTGGVILLSKSEKNVAEKTKLAEFSAKILAMKKRTMAGNAALLSVFSIIAKVISALYRVPLTSVLGAEGMGMYQLVFSIYALILALTTGGIPVAVSRLTSENNALKKDSRVVLKNALLSVVGTSVVLAAFLCVLSGFVARIQGNEGVKSGYYVIAPAVVFVGALSMFRGWFQGNNDVIPTAVSGLFEQVFKLAFGLTLAKILSKYGVIYGVIGALSGVMISEFIALIYIVITYFSRGKIYKTNAVESCDKDVRNAILKTSVVFAIAGFIIPFSQFIDGILIVNILKASGESISLATAKYGLYSGTVMSVVNMPVVLSVSLSVAIVPVIASATVKRNIDEIRKKYGYKSVQRAVLLNNDVLNTDLHEEDDFTPFKR